MLGFSKYYIAPFFEFLSPFFGKKKSLQYHFEAILNTKDHDMTGVVLSTCGNTRLSRPKTPRHTIGLSLTALSVHSYIPKVDLHMEIFFAGDEPAKSSFLRTLILSNFTPFVRANLTVLPG